MTYHIMTGGLGFELTCVRVWAIAVVRDMVVRISSTRKR
jgi:hypothetical protein